MRFSSDEQRRAMFAALGRRFATAERPIASDAVLLAEREGEGSSNKKSRTTRAKQSALSGFQAMARKVYRQHPYASEAALAAPLFAVPAVGSGFIARALTGTILAGAVDYGDRRALFGSKAPVSEKASNAVGVGSLGVAGVLALRNKAFAPLASTVLGRSTAGRFGRIGARMGSTLYRTRKF